ncbi:uncharacterized protein [Coffea arabica]|uniref:B3 domain-containing protein REM8-like n=1 Tax=Coffea arabica TaxID=13443 RepID=A0A6P6U403_COFAR|nr:uncharacterized protein LOC113706952 [Coffea arabica]
MSETSCTTAPDLHLAYNNLAACCFLLKCIHRGQIFPSQFELLLAQPRSSTIILRIGLQQWPIMVTNHSFGDGWDDFCEHNSIKRHDTILLRHAGGLMFDVIHFSELQTQVYMPWTAPLPNLLQTSYSTLQDTRQHHVASSMHPDLCQNLSESVCFYQNFHSATPNTLQIPRFVDHFINRERTPTLLIKTGHRTTQIGVKHGRLQRNWRTFILDHQLQHNEVLVFIPESETVFTVLIFDDTGVEKIFPWYHTFNGYSDA